MPRTQHPAASTLRNRNRITNKTRLKIHQGSLDADAILIPDEDEEKHRLTNLCCRQLNLEHLWRTPMMSRWKEDWEELELLGRGAFGSFVKASNKIDSRIYAVKNIRLKTMQSDTKIFREVNALSRLSHRNIVRYYTTWMETYEPTASTPASDSGMESGTESEDNLTSVPDDHDNTSERHLPVNGTFQLSIEDFDDISVSRSSFPMAPPRAQEVLTAATMPSPKTSSPEFVERQTLMEWIEEGIVEDEARCLFQQIVGALAHMSTLNILHRDIKLTNIFIDAKGDCKVGDFGLVTSSLAAVDPSDVSTPSVILDAELTLEVGTRLYIAPEVQSRRRMRGPGDHSEADMYSLGIVFFEMNFRFYTGSERIAALEDLRKPSIIFPPTWEVSLITWLLQHEPDKRPSAFELSNSSLLPTRLEDECYKNALRLMAKTGSKYHEHVLETLFSQQPSLSTTFTHDLDVIASEYASLNNLVEERLAAIFHLRGAVDMEPPLLIPVTDPEQEKTHATFIDRRGDLIALPNNILVPFARLSARRPTFRPSSTFKQPLINKAALFDIITPDLQTGPMAAAAEIIAVASDVLDSFPDLAQQYDIHVSHSTSYQPYSCRSEKVTHERTEFLHHSLETGMDFPPFADYQDVFSAPLTVPMFATYAVPSWIPPPATLLKMAKTVYPYWKERRIERGGNRIIPVLNGDESDILNEYYICFRRRENKAVRKTRAQQVPSSDKLQHLQMELQYPFELAKYVLAWETMRREAAKQAQGVWEKQMAMVDLKRKYPSLGDKLDEELLIDKERPSKRQEIARVPGLKLRASESVAPPSRQEIGMKRKERARKYKDAVDQVLGRIKEANNHWEDLLDNGCQTPPATYASKLFKYIPPPATPSWPPSLGSEKSDEEPPAPAPSARACILRKPISETGTLLVSFRKYSVAWVPRGVVHKQQLALSFVEIAVQILIILVGGTDQCRVPSSSNWRLGMGHNTVGLSVCTMFAIPANTDYAVETAHMEEERMEEERVEGTRSEEMMHQMIDLLEPSRGISAPDLSLLQDMLHAKSPEQVQSYDEAILLVHEASSVRHLSKSLLQHLKFQLLKAQREVSVMETKCNAAENYFRRVISLVAESGYNVSVSPGAEQKITVRKVTGDTVSVTSIPLQGHPTSVDVVLD
ncbi:hypothetical protein D9619_000083 [Psilocybe cf. subviscida]|uniref:Protein kinase domain-containing protein n=1 Tax=Psilocybe cf. subviscida TaxID=2480587 RepID=A0A8H5BFC7_9AGAR|nr:hypothetical protein D9619_000083 [Psilocybe cf. subviscida]